jgi:acyl-CoA thioester hydrolase
MVPPPPTVVVHERVRYAETDGMGIAYNANFLVWFEIGRTSYMRAAGLPYRDLEAAGYFMPVASFAGELREPLAYDDEFEIHTHVSRVRSRQVDFAYEIRRDGRLLATGMTSHICVDRERRPVAMPAHVRARLLAPEPVAGEGRRV